MKRATKKADGKLGWTNPCAIRTVMMSATERRAVVYGSERDFGMHLFPAIKVVARGSYAEYRIAAAALYRIAAAYEELAMKADCGFSLHIDRDKVGNPIAWVEVEGPPLPEIFERLEAAAEAVGFEEVGA